MMLALGALLAALGLTATVWQAAYTSRATLSPLPFMLAAAAAALTIGLLRRPAWREASAARAVRRALLVALVPLLISGLFAPSLDFREAAWVAAMRSDLRNLVTHQERVRADSGHFTEQPGPGLQLSTGVQPPEIVLTADGWSAVIRHRQSTRACTVYVGVQPVGPAERPGEPECVVTRSRLPDFALPLLALIVGLALALPRRPAA